MRESVKYLLIRQHSCPRYRTIDGPRRSWERSANDPLTPRHRADINILLRNLRNLYLRRARRTFRHLRRQLALPIEIMHGPCGL